MRLKPNKKEVPFFLLFFKKKSERKRQKRKKKKKKKKKGKRKKGVSDLIVERNEISFCVSFCHQMMLCVCGVESPYFLFPVACCFNVNRA